MTERVRATVFGEDADRYEAARPTYPAAAIDLITAHGPADAVDVGCGTGKAARLVAARGVRVTGIEPDERMAAVARGHGISVVVTSLERWVPTPCDVMYAAQAWHWVDPTIGAEVAAAAVRPGGRWAAIWNHVDDPRFHRLLDDVYGRFAPDLLEERRAGDDQALEHEVATALAATGAFDPVDAHEVPWVDELPAHTLVARLSTHSSHRLLDTDVAVALHAALLHDLGGAEAPVRLTYRTQVLVARRV